MNKNFEIKDNTYDRLIIILILLLALGGIGGAFQPVRLFIIVLIPFCITTSLKNRKLFKKYAYERHFFIFWLIYGFISLLWVYFIDEGVKELIYLFINFFGFYSIILLASLANKPQESVVKAWILLFIITIPIALYELWFDVHLDISAHGSDFYSNLGDGIVIQRFYASVTFGNLNGYNTMLTYFTPFLLGALIKNDTTVKKWNQLFILILLFLLIYIAIMNSSRGAIGAIIIMFVVFMLYTIRNVKSFIIFSIIFLSIGTFLYIEFREVFDFFLLRLELRGLGDKARAELISNGLDALVKSNFFGVGSANFMPTMSKVYGMENSSPHNFLLEVTVQYGLVIGILLIGMFIRIIHRLRNINLRRNKFIVVAALLSYPSASLINSGYLLNTSTWLYIASIYVIGDACFSNKIVNAN